MMQSVLQSLGRIAAACACCLACVAAYAGIDSVLYKRMASAPVGEVNLVGEKCVSEGRQDSAMTCYAVLADRYGSDMDDNDKQLCAEAMNNLGALFFTHDGDYARAYSYLVKALKTVSDEGFDYLKPYIYLNLTDVHEAFGDDGITDRLYREAFREAKRMGDWYAYQVAFVELAYSSVFVGSPGGIRRELDDFGGTRLPVGIKQRDYTMYVYSGVLSYGKGRYAEAEADFESACKSVDAVHDTRFYCFMADMLAAKSQEARGLYREAVGRLVRRVEAGGLPEGTMRRAYAMLAGLYAKAGCADSARVFEEKTRNAVVKRPSGGEYAALREIERECLGIGRAFAPPYAAVVLAVIAVSAAAAFVVLRRLRRRKRATAPGCQAGGAAGGVASEGRMQAADGPADSAQAAMIRRFMETSDAIYEQNFSIEKMATMLGLPMRTVSKTINEAFGMNFNALLARYRVDEACRRLSSDEYANMTIQAIFTDLGFKSRSNFIAVFRKQTGLTPLEYQKKSREGECLK